MVRYGLLESTRTENFGHLVWKRTELWIFEIFGIWYDLVYWGMVWYGMIQFVGIIYIYSHAKFQTVLLLFKIFGIWYLVLFGILWYSFAWYGVLVLCRYTTMQNFGLLAYDCLNYLVVGMIWKNRRRSSSSSSSSRKVKNIGTCHVRRQDGGSNNRNAFCPPSSSPS